MRKLTALLLALTLLLPLPVMAAAELTLDPLTEIIRPGKAVTIGFSAPSAGEVNLYLTDEAGGIVMVVMEAYAAVPGSNTLWWNGTYQGAPAPEGSYLLTVQMGDQTASTPVTVGVEAPYLTGIAASAEVITPEAPVEVTFYASVDGFLTQGAWVKDTWRSLSTTAVEAGWQSVIFDGTGLSDGPVALTLTLSDAAGYPSNEEHVNVTVSGFQSVTAPPPVTATPAPEESLPDLTTAPEDALDLPLPEASGEPVREELSLDGDMPAVSQDDGVFTPAHGSPYEGQDTALNYWTLPMDITDEAAVWEMLMQPITVIDGNEKNQTSLWSEPSEDSTRVAVVTRATQGVHVLENLDNGWSLVECYSSSFHDSKVKAWNMLTQGYVKTSELKTITPADDYGIVIDKLTQRLYLFKDGALFSTMDVSTGLANDRQPYNETRSGEFLLTSAVGAFSSDNLVCGLAIRFNDGDLLHEVPHVVNKDGTKNYGYTEPSLGERASHGCIRVQRKRTPEGVNMQWLWNNRKRNIKLVIWEDWQGRQIPIPDDDFTLYYNAAGNGKYYHSQEKCYSAKDSVTFTPFTYAELDTGDFAKLERCPYCVPEKRREVLEEINAKYLPGGDHDPVITRAREKYLNGEYD